MASAAESLEDRLQAADSPVVFCHNDMTGGNILVNWEQKRVTLIDFEYDSPSWVYFSYR
jgi:thiamine kinase-like enzyme